MFMEFKMTSMEAFGEYFGFTDTEVDALYKKYIQICPNPQVSRQGLQEWYDGYFTATGKRLYNPRSVVMALRFNQLSNYWTSSGPYDEIFYYINKNIADEYFSAKPLDAFEQISKEARKYGLFLCIATQMP